MMATRTSGGDRYYGMASTGKTGMILAFMILIDLFLTIEWL